MRLSSIRSGQVVIVKARPAIDAAVMSLPFSVSNQLLESNSVSSCGVKHILKIKLLLLLLQNGDRPNVPNVAIVITDGQSNYDHDLTIPDADIDKAAGITLFAVGVTDQINLVELDGIASLPTASHVFTSADIIDITANILQELSTTLCTS